MNTSGGGVSTVSGQECGGHGRCRSWASHALVAPAPKLQTGTTAHQQSQDLPAVTGPAGSGAPQLSQHGHAINTVPGQGTRPARLVTARAHGCALTSQSPPACALASHPPPGLRSGLAPPPTTAPTGPCRGAAAKIPLAKIPQPTLLNTTPALTGLPWRCCAACQ